MLLVDRHRIDRGPRLSRFSLDLGVIGITTFVVQSSGGARDRRAGTDYGIFFRGAIQEARQAGEDKKRVLSTFSSVAKGGRRFRAAIAGAILCLHFTRLPVYQALGVPTVGMTATRMWWLSHSFAVYRRG